MTRYLLFVNAKSGKGKNTQELESFLKAAREFPEMTVHIIEKTDDLRKIVRKALREGVQVIGAAGGDGTINSIAATLIGTKVPLVVIPFGTLNHFARDLNITGTPTEALQLFTGEYEKAIDVGEVNGFYFLNNSSVGLYPALVKQREKYEKQLGKLVAYGLAGWQVLRHPRLLRVRMKIEDKTENIKTGILFFSNNRAKMSPIGAGHRPRLDGQVLEAYIVRASSFFQFVRVAHSFLLNKLESSPLVTQVELCDVTVYAHQRYLRVACDGEVHDIPSPLNYKILPGALIVRMPPDAPVEPDAEANSPAVSLAQSK